mmetsp:Transcript_39227/g.83582  ORF Transcript_39227/g.83582 Transcript_39227/m.83582 type:complete len:217 (-) Transcript_39227:200-850(-)
MRPREYCRVGCAWCAFVVGDMLASQPSDFSRSGAKVAFVGASSAPPCVSASAASVKRPCSCKPGASAARLARSSWRPCASSARTRVPPQGEFRAAGEADGHGFCMGRSSIAFAGSAKGARSFCGRRSSKAGDMGSSSPRAAPLSSGPTRRRPSVEAAMSQQAMGGLHATVLLFALVVAVERFPHRGCRYFRRGALLSVVRPCRRQCRGWGRLPSLP